nr:MAG TPA: hypothetical protein [Caudoviricetes sp.]
MRIIHVMTVIFIARKGGTTALMRSRKIFDQEISWDVFQKKAKLLLMLVEHRHVETGYRLNGTDLK